MSPKIMAGRRCCKTSASRWTSQAFIAFWGGTAPGKTTLLKAMAGYVPLSQGRITVDGRPISTACMETGVSYIENFARHFNLPVRRLLHIAGGLDTSFDFAFAARR